jgi:uncharacterized protein YndB with AHSA1/START domain
MRAEIPIGASRDVVWNALTDSRKLEQWFCEHADVSLRDGRFDFWGVYTPDVPDREDGRHAIVKVVERELLSYAWRIRGEDTTVELTLADGEDETIVRLSHDCPAPSEETTDIPGFWSLALEHGLRGFAEFGVAGAGRFDFRLPTVHPDHTEVCVEIDAPREHVFGVLIADLEQQWWVTDEVRHKVRYDPPSEASTPFVMEGAHESVLTWTLEDSHGRTRVTLVHSGFGPGEKGNIRGAMGWTNSIYWLKFASEFGPSWHDRRQRSVIDYGRASQNDGAG